MPEKSWEESDAAGEGTQRKRHRFAEIDRFGHAISLAVVLFIVWLLLSGHYQPLLLVLGVASCIVIVIIAARMDVIDREALPLHLTVRIVGYWSWLTKEICVAAIDVTKRVLSPALPISPTMIQLETTQLSELGQVIYANSITLTPGTFTLRVFDDQIVVHALTREAAEGLAEGEMDRRVTALEDNP